jgi:hypothetical protein
VPSKGQDLHNYLKNGIVLCKAVNAIKSGECMWLGPSLCLLPLARLTSLPTSFVATGSVKTISTSSAPFPQMENISAYLAVCKAWGMKSSDLFMTKDLYENANMGKSLPSLSGSPRHLQHMC